MTEKEIDLTQKSEAPEDLPDVKESLSSDEVLEQSPPATIPGAPAAGSFAL